MSPETTVSISVTWKDSSSGYRIPAIQGMAKTKMMGKARPSGPGLHSQLLWNLTGKLSGSPGHCEFQGQHRHHTEK